MKNRIILFLSFSFVLFSCNRESQNAGEIGAHIHMDNDVAVFRVPVRISVVSNADIQKTIRIYGKLSPKEETKLSSQFSGRILNLTLSEGDRVKKGETVAIIQSPQAEGLQQIKEGRSVNRERQGEIVPFSIRAPISGIITKKIHFTGDVISVGETILEIQDDSVYYLWGQLPAAFLNRVTIGRRLNIVFPDLPGKTYTSQIGAINSNVDQQTQMGQIRASLKNPQHLLKANLFARIDIVLKAKKDVPVIPRNAVLGDNGTHFVFLKKGGKAVQKEFVPGIENENNIEVSSGLTVGDSIIIQGHYELKEGMKVEVVH